MTILRRGSHGQDVIILQDKFVRLGFLPANHVDGASGREVEVVVKAFQSRNDLVVTGVVDESTAAKIDEAVAKRG